MPNVLVISFEEFSFSSRQLYEHLLPKLLSRAAIHESTIVQDALNYILSGWPNVILIADPVIAEDTDKHRRLLEAVADHTRHGCTTVLMGLFAVAIESETLDARFKEYFDLRWRVAESTTHQVRLMATDESMIRTASLFPVFHANAVFLGRVPAAQTVYAGSSGATMTAYAAYARVGLGKLGYIGDTNFGEEPERLILAMCHLDRPEDSL
ncbi:hypothetical protein BU26DRAFT_332003 [Trematosphaeria pertusa]|uniref:Uncharacterized protein n=1 Tax=Trematosphaeria pertusa TaxID=390896 RepID=A0A6A6IEM0_9PLEO|nr:uncharacterized protein BU26DRAFT_332003 [Trematosphaeria pertusa]KAF2248352.1 hypothetical protein BU26DRAFT_332003 [Trematosphaeria pertusa]